MREGREERRIRPGEENGRHRHQQSGDDDSHEGVPALHGEPDQDGHEHRLGYERQADTKEQAARHRVTANRKERAHPPGGS